MTLDTPLCQSSESAWRVSWVSTSQRRNRLPRSMSPMLSVLALVSFNSSSSVPKSPPPSRLRLSRQRWDCSRSGSSTVIYLRSNRSCVKDLNRSTWGSGSMSSRSCLPVSTLTIRWLSSHCWISLKSWAWSSLKHSSTVFLSRWSQMPLREAPTLRSSLTSLRPRSQC